MKFSPTLPRMEAFYVRDYIQQYGDGMLVL